MKEKLVSVILLPLVSCNKNFNKQLRVLLTTMKYDTIFPWSHQQNTKKKISIDRKGWYEPGILLPTTSFIILHQQPLTTSQGRLKDQGLLSNIEGLYSGHCRRTSHRRSDLVFTVRQALSLLLLLFCCYISRNGVLGWLRDLQRSY